MIAYYWPDLGRRVRYLEWYWGCTVNSGLRYGQVYATPGRTSLFALCTCRESPIGSSTPGSPGPFVQVYEQLYWGSTSSNVFADPNPRLEAYIAAARRGATVRVLLDAYFDNQDLASPRSNLRTVEYLTAVAQAEGLDLQARRGNPTGQGIHNKMLLAQIGGQGWVIAGSLNGREASAKLNREMALLAGSDGVHDYLADVFWYDWDVTP